MEIINMKIGDLIPYENNPRKNDEAVEYVANSIREFGFKVPIVVDKDNVIVAGHTRLKAAQLLGLEEVPVVVADDLTPERIKAFRLADNKVSDFAIWDNKLLLEELEDIGSDIFTGFDLGGVFDDVLDEDDNKPIEENTSGVTYEIVARSKDRKKIERLQSLWEQVENEYE